MTMCCARHRPTTPSELEREEDVLLPAALEKLEALATDIGEGQELTEHVRLQSVSIPWVCPGRRMRHTLAYDLAVELVVDINECLEIDEVRQAMCTRARLLVSKS